jgi:hypothetical protein
MVNNIEDGQRAIDKINEMTDELQLRLSAKKTEFI